jgi:hypothetical protein
VPAPAPAPAKAAAKAAPAPAPKAASPSPAAKPAPAPTPAAKPSPAPVAKPAPPAPTKASEAKTGALEPYGSVTEPVPKQKVLSAAAVNPAAATTPQTYDEEDDMGEGMTRVRMGPTPAPGQAMDGLTDPGLGEVPVVTDTRAAHEPSAPPVPDDSTVHGEAEGPAWIKRAALLDTDSDRTAARERMQAIDSDVGRLTIERPTTTALGEGAEADEEPEGDGDGEAPEADGDDAGDA